MTPADETLRGLWREVSPSTRTTYRQAWRRWCEWCGIFGIDPCRATTDQAQDWVNSQRQQGLAAATVRTRVYGVRVCHEYLAMLGHQPNEPMLYVVLPATVRRGPRPVHAIHEPLSTERIARALYATRGDDRAHCVLWACAGMGLSTAELADMDTDRIRRHGDTSVAVVRYKERAMLYPVPREMLLIVNERGWPIRSSNPASSRELVKIALQPYLSTSAQALYAWHRDAALGLGFDFDPRRGWRNDSERGRWVEHPATVVCALLRDMLIEIAT